VGVFSEHSVVIYL